MKRFIMKDLIAWKNKGNRKPLVMKGVRQCGKTYILQEFGKQQYASVAYFNFEENSALASVFDSDFNTKRILLELSLLISKTIEAHNTLIIFDEIQACPKALTSLKYFCENANEYHIVCAGSLLGIAIHENHSFPVGKVDFLTLYPMSFYEYLIAMGEVMLAEYLMSISKKDSISDLIGNKLTSLLKQYYITGGMPEVVKTWTKTQSIEAIEQVQKLILSSYELDFVKHASPQIFPKLTAIWSSIPQQLSKPNNKFIFSHVKKGWRAKDLEDALQWLIQAGLVYKVCKIEKPYLPLSAYADHSSFKLYLSDIGLLRCLSKLPYQVISDASHIYTEFKGAMSENYVLNELVKSIDETPYYWTSGNSAEVDFVIQYEAEVVPIEVKSEKNVKARSLSEYRKKYDPSFSVITSMKSDTKGDQVVQVPLYAIASLKSFLL